MEISDSKFFIQVVNEIFTPNECDEIITLGLRHPLEPGLITGAGNAPELRKCKTRYFDPSEVEWIEERCAKYMHQVNSAAKYDVTGFEERFKFMRYDEGDHFNKWHMDSGSGYQSRRKLSIVVQLSDPTTYDGGDFENVPDPNCTTCTGKGAYRQRGTAIIFPSFMLHHVTPVTRGTRFSLTNWISGPPLR